MTIEQARQIASKAIEELSHALEAGHSEKLREYLGAMARFIWFATFNQRAQRFRKLRAYRERPRLASLGALHHGLDDLRGVPAAVRFVSAEPLLESLHDIDLAGIHWLIAGGESGSGFRTMKDEWALELRDRCREQGVAFHFKQHSAFRPGTDPLLHGIKYHESPLVQIATAAAPEPADEDTDRDLPISPEEADDETRGTRDRAQG